MCTKRMDAIKKVKNLKSRLLDLKALEVDKNIVKYTKKDCII